MIYLKTDEGIELMRLSNLLVARTLGEVAKHIKPGVTTLELDKIAETYIRDNKGIPGFLNYHGFPNTLCTSVNEQVVHGIPNKKPLNEGEVVSVDCGSLLNGYFGDSAYTFCVGEVKPDVKPINKTKETNIEPDYSKIAFILRTPELEDCSLMILNLPNSQVFFT